MKKLYTIVLFSFVCTIANAQGTWTQKQNLGGFGRGYAVGFSIGLKGYIGTGIKYNGPGGTQGDFWEWDQPNNTWTQKANFGGVARRGAVGFSIGTKGYIGTGDGSTDLWEFDPSANSWTQKTNFGGSARNYAVGFPIGMKGYIGTGENWNGTILYNEFWEWDQSNNTWTQKANFGGAGREGAVGFSIGTKGYIGTGDTAGGSGGPTKDFWEWDQLSNTWTQKANFGGIQRMYAIGFSIGSRGYIGTGSDCNGLCPAYDFWEWDQGTNVWAQKANYNGVGGYGVYGGVGFSIGSKGYIGTGYDNTYYYNDFWEYCDTCLSGVNEITPDNLIEVYPNPTTANVQISGLENVKIKAINIFNVAGEKIYESTNSHIGTCSHLQIDLSFQPSGVYFLQLKTEQGVANKKIIISR